MRISTQTDIIFPAFGIDEGMKIFKEAGFDALDFSMFYMNSSRESVLGNMGEDELVNKLLESSEKYSLPFNQAHAPFPSYRFGDEEYNKFVYEKLKLSIHIAGKIGASQIIVHPTMPGRRGSEAVQHRFLQFAKTPVRGVRDKNSSREYVRSRRPPPCYARKCVQLRRTARRIL